MRSILAKVAVISLVTLGFITQETEAKTLKNLVQHSADAGYQTNMMPTRLAELLLGKGPATAPPA